MRARTLLITGTLTTMFVASGVAQDIEAPRPPLAVSSVTVTIEGTSRRGPFLASTRTVHVTRQRLAAPWSQDILEQAVRPGQLEVFDVTIPVTTLTSPDEGVAEHIHDSLKADTHPDIRFQLRSIQNGPDHEIGFERRSANGTLTIAGVDRDVTLDVKVLRSGRLLLLDGRTDLLMTDFGVKPPPGRLWMLKSNPLVHVRFYLAVTAADR